MTSLAGAKVGGADMSHLTWADPYGGESRVHGFKGFPRVGAHRDREGRLRNISLMYQFFLPWSFFVRPSPYGIPMESLWSPYQGTLESACTVGTGFDPSE